MSLVELGSSVKNPDMTYSFIWRLVLVLKLLLLIHGNIRQEATAL